MKKWALIVGGSSGMGLATAKKLAKEAYNLFIIHRDRRSVLEQFEADKQALIDLGVSVHTFNMDATNPEKITEVVASMAQILGTDRIFLLLHGVSRGNLKSLNPDEDSWLSDQDMALTMDAMAINFLSWSRKLHQENLLAPKARMISLTSSGSTRYWSGYAAVGMAKAALENLTQYMAVEFAPLGYRVNCIHAGVTDTPSLRIIPNADTLKENVVKKNPFHRLTTPEDVANCVYLLSLPEADWINGSILRVDGGEHFA